MVTKSPQTGLYLFCITGGELGPAMKRSGFDVIVLTGRSEAPVYVEVTGGTAKLHPASHLWGLDTQAAQEYIRDELPGGKLAITCIGPGGERQVPYACLINERRALGRGGAGAVMGSKNVKALVVRAGEDAAPVADPARFKAAVRALNEELRSNPFTSGPLKLHRVGQHCRRHPEHGDHAGRQLAALGREGRGRRAARRRSTRALPGQGRALRRPLPEPLLEGDGGA